MAAKRADKGTPGKKGTAKAAKASKIRKPSGTSAPGSAAKKTTPAKATPQKTAKSDATGGRQVGDLAPSFSLPDQRGKIVGSDSLRGKSYVLYFYPKDDTPGCTREACGFRDDLGKLKAAGATIIGVSPDKPESHAKFERKYGLNFTLLSDVEKVLAHAYGVWVKKQNYGREYMGIERSTFLVGADGKIRKVWRRVKVDGHVAAVHAAMTDGT